MIINVIKKEKQIFYCKLCNVHFGTNKLYEVHNNTKKHIKMTLNPGLETNKTPKNAQIYDCKKCNENFHM